MAVWDIYVKFQVVVYRVYTYTSESLLMMFFYSVLAGDSSYKLYVSKSLLLKKVVFFESTYRLRKTNIVVRQMVGKGDDPFLLGS